MDKTHGPISDRYRERMNGLARGIADVLGEGVLFTLLVYEPDPKDGRVNYISNGRREDTVTAMKELIARFDGRYQETSAKQ
jgi:hypothetical protein